MKKKERSTMSIVRAQAAAHDSAIPLQPASHDIWDKKYRLKAKSGEPVDADVDGTYQRVAKALSDVEATDELRAAWNERFLWALRRGAIPAGRITSNAGALAHKPATSTINCTVSGTITDSMDDILEKVHEAGLTLKAGCGIGYEFSTLRPRGAYVSGAGAHTSGPLSFMDIYDKMCFTVSSAGGRRGAQMGTFDISHPDAKEFIRAKREDGRLRQFNLSLLITDGFMDAVADDLDWPLVFPVHVKEKHEVNLEDPTQVVWREWPTAQNYVPREDGLVACKIYGHIRARHLWDMIMVSTYDFAEPGFILIDRVNEMNNNWWCEHIRATNPCVTADTWVQTAEGPKQVADLIGTAFAARVDGKDHLTGAEGFFLTAHKPVVKLATKEGHALRLTADHRVRKVVNKFVAGIEGTEWCAAGDLKSGDQVLLNNHTSNTEWDGLHGREEGYLLGQLIASQGLERAQLSFQTPAKSVNGPDTGYTVWALQDAAFEAAQALGVADAQRGYSNILDLPTIGTLASDLGLAAGSVAWGSSLEKTSSAFHRGFLSGLFDVSGAVGSDRVVLTTEGADQAATVQRMLLRLGVSSSAEGHVVSLRGSNVAAFGTGIGFGSVAQQDQLDRLVVDTLYAAAPERFTTTVASITPDGEEAVYDVQVPGINTFDANGLHAHNCGEQPLPPYGSCLLGSINLTTFVRDPFGPKARFDWDEYREVVKVFTRMLDNVVEINGLPLERQRQEIESKRRHGMGFLGLGSTLTMLKMRYGTADAVTFTEDVSREMAVAGWEMALDLAKEKGPAPILAQEFDVTGDMLRKRPEMVKDGYKVGQKIRGSVLHAKYSRYMQRVAEVAPELVAKLAETGARFTHHSSIAPTGTISLSLANNASNGIEPSFAHHYSRNVIREGKKSKEKVEVYSYELLAYRALINADALPYSEDAKSKLPEYFVSADDISPKEHVDIQAASQKWIDSSISKTANVPTDYPYEDFKDIYFYAYKQGLKGCTTFRFNPAAFQGVLVKESDLESTLYRFELEDGSVVELKGNEQVEYDGEMHSAANLFDALKEGYYGKF
jgi:ribonucleoside-diphosphate reductase alpha chain